MRKLLYIVVLCVSASCFAFAEEPVIEPVRDYVADTATGLYDAADNRIYLRDIRQILGWVVGLQLVRLTCQVLRPY